MGATDESVVCHTYLSAGAITAADQFKFVEFASGVVSVANADTDVIIGVLYGGLPTTAAGEAVAVAVSGKVKVRAGAALATTGIQVTSDATGRVQAAIAGDRPAGILMSTAAGAGEMVEVELIRAGALLV